MTAVQQLMVEVYRTATQTQVTTKISQELVKTMLSASIGCIAYLRGIFPDESFLEERYSANIVPKKSAGRSAAAQDSGQRLMRLRKDTSPEVQKLLDYLELGVYDALEKQYLTSVIFSISLDSQRPDEVHEAYTFQFAYSHGKSPSLSISDSKRGRTTASMPLDAAKRSLQQLFRQLIAMTQSLAPLPEEVNKLISIRLFFKESTPEGYQPFGFRAASDAESARFVTGLKHEFPHDQEIGSLRTGYHTCTLNVTSLDDASTQRLTNTESRKLWDAEHHARSACQHAHPESQYVTSIYTIPPSYDSQMLQQAVEKDGLDKNIGRSQAMDLNKDELVPSSSHNDTAMPLSQPLGAQKTADVQATDTIDGLEVSCTRLVLDQDAPQDVEHDNVMNKEARPSTSQCRATKHLGDDHAIDIVTCECGDNTDEGSMIQCETCQGWCHLPCYGYLNTSLASDATHKCYTCRMFSADDLHALKALAVSRHVLHSLWTDGYKYESIKDFAVALGYKDLELVKKLLDRFTRDGWLETLTARAVGTKSTRSQPKSAYKVLRTAFNKKRLQQEYFDPSIGLPVQESLLSTGPGPVTPCQKDPGSRQQASVAATQRKSQASIDQDAQKRSPNLQVEDTMAAASAPLTVQNKRKRGRSSQIDSHHNSKALNVSQRCEDTTDDDLDEGLDLAKHVSSTSMIVKTTPRASPRLKKIRISIVKKPVIAYAFDTMSN